MDFYEFLAKKKIDRSLFSSAEPGLYREFEEEYAQMGPKSFDHSKKFLFNKLRRTYHLDTVVVAKPAIPKGEKVESDQPAPVADASPAGLATGFKPRFKPGMVKPAPPVDQPEPESKPEPVSPPMVPGFKPRFKPGTVKPVPSSPELPLTASESDVPEGKSGDPQGEPTPKPAYKPKFQAKNMGKKPE